MLRHRAAAACACLTVGETVAGAYCTPEEAAQIRQADGFLHNHCPNLISRVFTEGFLLTRFSTIMDYHFLTENYFPTMCTTIRSYSVEGGFDYK